MVTLVSQCEKKALDRNTIEFLGIWKQLKSAGFSIRGRSGADSDQRKHVSIELRPRVGLNNLNLCDRQPVQKLHKFMVIPS